MRCAEVVTLDASYAEELAELHAKALPDDVLPALGLPFLVRYYAAVLADASQAVFGAVHEGSVTGFCQLSFSPVSMSAVMKSNPRVLLMILKLAWADTAALIRGVVMALHRPHGVAGLPEISFIAVHPGFQRRGIGKRLVDTANELARAKGCSRLFTKTANAAAKVMYETSFGARQLSTVTALGRRYWYLSWDPKVRDGNDDVAR
jgi:ribosomal protein S18 acetylase RimI-like enzyme